MLINNAAAARNPRNWNKPKVPPERSAALLDSPALYINPDRWLKVTDKANNSKSKSQNLRPGRYLVPDEGLVRIRDLRKSS
jgi:hypothetical protein